MTGSQLSTLRRALLRRLAEIVRSVPIAERAGAREEQVEADPGDEEDDAILDQLDGISGELGDREAHLADAIVAALDRMRTGEYGICVDCGKEIPFERLQALPWAERCAEDQAAVDGATVHPTL